MNMILLGAPGAGKGSVASILKHFLGFVHISTGDILREEIKKKSPLGLKAKFYIDQGKLVPDVVVTKLIEHKFLTDKDISKGYMLDGFPRTAKQAQDLDKILKRVKKPLDCAFYLEATEPVIIQRLAGRRVCKNCGALYHTKNKPPKVKGKCNKCGGKLYRRPDDNPHTIETRLKVYFKITKPVIAYYDKQGLIKKLNSDLDSEELYDQIKSLRDENTKRH